MPKLTIGFSTPKSTWSPFPWMIRTIENTSYSHVYVRWDNDVIERTIVYQASGLKVNFISYPNFLAIEDVIEEYSVEVTAEQIVKVHQFAYDNADKPYGIMDIFGLGYVLLARKLGFNPSNPVHDDGTEYVCSEMVSYVLRDCLGIQMPESINLMIPKDVNSLVKQLPGVIKL